MREPHSGPGKWRTGLTKAITDRKNDSDILVPESEKLQKRRNRIEALGRD